MKKLLVPLVAGALMACVASAQQRARKPGLYAVFNTSMGTFVCEI